MTRHCSSVRFDRAAQSRRTNEPSPKPNEHESSHTTVRRCCSGNDLRLASQGGDDRQAAKFRIKFFSRRGGSSIATSTAKFRAAPGNGPAA